MKPKPLPPIEILNSLFDYDPETGVVRWKNAHYNKSGNCGHAQGAVAGAMSRSGYLVVYMNNPDGSSILRQLHRVVWALAHGCDPGPMQVDHIDGDKTNNAKANLRLAGHGENRRNARNQKNCTSGVKGVNYRKDSNSWRARIMVDRKSISLGCFQTLEAAKQAIVDARPIHHGQFANHG
jgi:hypothetical protein